VSIIIEMNQFISIALRSLIALLVSALRSNWRFDGEPVKHSTDLNSPVQSNTLTQLLPPLLWETLVFYYCLLIICPRLRHYSWQWALSAGPAGHSYNLTPPPPPLSTIQRAERLGPAVVGPQPLDRKWNQPSHL